MYLTERQLLFSINHVFSSVTGKREREDFEWFRIYFPAIETRNSHMLEKANAHAAKLAKRWQKIEIGGSDAHALPSAWKAYTEVSGARNKEEFFAGLRGGMGRVAGESGCFSKLTRDVLVIAYEMMREKAWTTLLLPLGFLIPAITCLNYYDENKFCRHWGAELFGQPETRNRLRWITAPQPAVEEWV
jgi:hypothetical protein